LTGFLRSFEERLVLLLPTFLYARNPPKKIHSVSLVETHPCPRNGINREEVKKKWPLSITPARKESERERHRLDSKKKRPCSYFNIENLSQAAIIPPASTC
jgi:hypothetical protein